VRSVAVVFAALALACTAAAGWGAHYLWQAATRVQPVKAVDALVQRCSVQMVKDTCRVMKTPASGQAGARLFIAGVGEVDAATFTAMRSYGDEMCQAVGAQCASDWEGANCRIARALYPMTSN
jgi:hypothetical protein